MQFRFSDEDEAFRSEVRDVILSEVPGQFLGLSQEAEFDDEDVFAVARRFTKKLGERKWLAMAWPREYGGLEATYTQQLIYNHEMAYHGAPGGGGHAVAWVGPAIMLYGTDDQKRTYLPRITAGDDIWCTLYSEPGAGSDLASLQTRAVRDGDDFIINGQKIWTSGGHLARYGWLAARTDPDAPKHKGISTFVIDMKAPGVTVAPLVNMVDMHSFNQVFFDNVRIPKENLVGDLNRGWYNVAVALDFERSGIQVYASGRRHLETFVKFAKERPELNVGAHKHATKVALADRWIEALVARMMSYRVVSMQQAGLIPNHEASMCKLFTSEMGQKIAALGLKMSGLYGMVIGGHPTYSPAGRYGVGYMAAVSSTIAGGTSEIQRNIMAQRGLGLPRD